ncbi:MAG: CaiB/BaiF CoA transferase family protein [Nitrososphaerales archaeon]
MKGIRVLEVSHAIAGPTASQILADYGAEVIKVERPGEGDIFRDTPDMGPSMFLAVNRGKRSAVIDLKNPKGLRLFYDLVRISDVIVENMGPGASERLGITYGKIKRSNSRAIYCRIESFGKGPYESIPAFDPVLQAAVGIMSTTGFPPKSYARAGVSIVDVSAGLHAACGILALLNRRNKTGKGGELRVSLYEAASYFMSYWVARYDLFKKDTRPLGSTHVFGSPYNLFRSRDGYVYIAVASDETWASFCKSLGFYDLQHKKIFANSSQRVKRKKSLERIISERLSKLSTGQIMGKLRDSGVPVAKLNTAKSLLRDPHFLGSGLLRRYRYSGKSFRTVVNPSIVDGSRQFTEKPPPTLGSDSESILRSLLSKNGREIRLLKEQGVIRS